MFFVVNVEEEVELSLVNGNERNEAAYQVRSVPDLCRESYFECGTCVGYWRIIWLLD